MAGPDLPSTSIQSIDLTLNRLINFRKNLQAKLVMHPVNGSELNGMNSSSEIKGIDTHMVKSILEENPGVKEQRDSAKFFQLAVIKILDKIIDEHIQKFHESKQLEKEIMLLEGRLKDSQKTEEERQKVQADLNKLNSLEALERAKMLMMLNALQTLNDRYLYLEGEKQKSIKNFTQSMEKTLDGLIKKDGTPLTVTEKKTLNKDLSQSETSLIQELMEKEYNKLEGRTFNDMLRSLGPKKERDIPGLRSGNTGFFAAYGVGENDIFSKVTSSAEFKDRHAKLVEEQANKYGIDPTQAKNLAEARAEKIAKSPEARAVAEVSYEQKLVEKQYNGASARLKEFDQNLSKVNFLDKREQMLASASSKKAGSGMNH